MTVPLMDQYSPVGIAVALEVHWHHPDVCHRGIETIYRQMLRVAYIIGGRQLATSIKQGCRRCRNLYKKSLDVAMGPIQNVNLCIAPPFFACQMDILGPYKAYSSHGRLFYEFCRHIFHQVFLSLWLSQVLIARQ